MIDLGGMKQEARMPVLLEHKRELLVGRVQKCDIANSVDFETEFFDTPPAAQVRTAASKGFQYQASVGFDVGKVKYVGSKESYQCNGRSFAGPLTVITESTLREISCVLWGRDSTTSVKLSDEKGNPIMTRPAELAELRGEFGESPAFVLEALDAKWSIEEANKEWIKRAREKLAADKLAQETAIANERQKLADAQKAAEELAAKNAAAARNSAPPSPSAPARGADPIQMAAPNTTEGHTPGLSITMQSIKHKPCAEPFMTHDDVLFFERYGNTANIHGKMQDPNYKDSKFENLPW